MVILTENHTLVPPGDLQGLIDMAVAAERGGANAVMLSDHVCLGPEAGAPGQPRTPETTQRPETGTWPPNGRVRSLWPRQLPPVSRSVVGAASSTTA